MRDRRKFLRHSLRLGGLSVLGGALAGCVDDGPNLDGANGDNGGGSTESDLVLESGMKFGVLFTGPGGLPGRSDVDPDEPGGGRSVTVEDGEPGEQATISWRQTIEREIPPSETPDVGVGSPTPTPRVELVEQTGTISVTGLGEAHESFLPMFWKPGETTTDTSGLWLSQAAYQELRDTRQTRWSADPLTSISWVGDEAQQRIRDGVQEVDEVVLNAEADFIDFELSVDGQQSSVRAIEAHDSFGNRYVILANEANPLILKFSYDVVSVGFSGFDTALWTLIKSVFSGYQVMSIDAG